MSEISRIFKKFGGFDLIKQYAHSGVLPYALLAAPVLGLDRKGLELFRLAVQNKTEKKLKRKYYKELIKYDNSMQWNDVEHNHSHKIWICWLQGIENAPFVVKRCYESLNKNIPDREIVVLTAENISQYVSFPEYIMEKWKSGIITNTHFSDLLRLEILARYGGTWLDATVLCTGGDIPSYMLDSDLFFFQILKPGRDGHCLNMSSWLLTACSNHKILMATRNLIYKYWETHDSMYDYFLLHMFMEISCNYYVDEYKKMMKFSNSIPHILLLDFFEPYDEKKYKEMRRLTPFHKLAYKLDKADMEKMGTYYDLVINQGMF